MVQKQITNVKRLNLKPLLTIFALFFCLALAGQQAVYNPYFQLEPGNSYYLLADKVNIREAASKSSPLQACLPIGSKLQIIEQSPAILSIKKLKAPWYKIRYTLNSQQKEGFVWGGFIALGQLTSPIDSNVQFLYGFCSNYLVMKEGYPHKATKLQVRAVRQQQEISKLEFETLGALSSGLSASIKDDCGIAEIESILSFSFNDGYCGGALGRQVVFWDAQQLHFIKTLDNGFDAPYFKHEYLIYPCDKEGEAGKIIYQLEEGQYDEEGMPHYILQKKEKWQWINGKFSIHP